MLSKGFKKYFFNTTWLLFENLLRLSVSVVVISYVARYLGPSKFGLLSYASSYVALFSVLATLGLEVIAVRELITFPEKTDLILGTAFKLKLIGSLCAVMLIIPVAFLTNTDIESTILIAIIAPGLVMQSFNIIESYFQSKVISRYIVYVKLLQFLISSCIKLFLVYIKASLILFAVLLALDQMCLALGYIYVYKKYGLLINRWEFDLSLAKQLLRYSWPLVLSGIAISIYMKIDQVMIKQMLGVSEVGNYGVAVRIAEIMFIFPNIINNSLFPAIINARKIDNKLYDDRMQKLYDLMVALSLLIVIVIMLNAGNIINTLFGNEYIYAAKILMIYIWALPFIFSGMAWGKWLISENLQNIAFYFTFVGALSNIVLNYIFIKKYGVYGAAYSTLVSQFILCYLLHAFNKKTFRSFIMQTKAFLRILFPLYYSRILFDIFKKRSKEVFP